MAEADSLGLSTKQHYVTITIKHLHSYVPQESCMPILFPVYPGLFAIFTMTRFLITYASRELLLHVNHVKNMIKRFENLLLSL